MLPENSQLRFHLMVDDFIHACALYTEDNYEEKMDGELASNLVFNTSFDTGWGRYLERPCTLVVHRSRFVHDFFAGLLAWTAAHPGECRGRRYLARCEARPLEGLPDEEPCERDVFGAYRNFAAVAKSVGWAPRGLKPIRVCWPGHSGDVDEFARYVSERLGMDFFRFEHCEDVDPFNPADLYVGEKLGVRLSFRIDESCAECVDPFTPHGNMWVYSWHVPTKERLFEAMATSLESTRLKKDFAGIFAKFLEDRLDVMAVDDVVRLLATLSDERRVALVAMPSRIKADSGLPETRRLLGANDVEAFCSDTGAWKGFAMNSERFLWLVCDDDGKDSGESERHRKFHLETLGNACDCKVSFSADAMVFMLSHGSDGKARLAAQDDTLPAGRLVELVTSAGGAIERCADFTVTIEPNEFALECSVDVASGARVDSDGRYCEGDVLRLAVAFIGYDNMPCEVVSVREHREGFPKIRFVNASGDVVPVESLKRNGGYVFPEGEWTVEVETCLQAVRDGTVDAGGRAVSARTRFVVAPCADAVRIDEIDAPGAVSVRAGESGDEFWVAALAGQSFRIKGAHGVVAARPDVRPWAWRKFRKPPLLLGDTGVVRCIPGTCDVSLERPGRCDIVIAHISNDGDTPKVRAVVHVESILDSTKQVGWVVISAAFLALIAFFVGYGRTWFRVLMVLTLVALPAISVRRRIFCPTIKRAQWTLLVLALVLCLRMLWQELF